MTLYMIGLGLGDKKDITLKGLEAIKNSDIVFLENYTSVLSSSKEELEEFYGKEIILASRDLVEKNSDEIIIPAKTKNVCFLVVGDVFGATTHADIYLRAKKQGISIKIISNTSIINAVGITGLGLYRFGKTTSIVFDEDWLPETPYNAIKENLERGLHTLCLLDIKVAEPSRKNLLKGINTPEPSRFMNVSQGIEVLQKIEIKRKENIITNDTFIIGIARLGRENSQIKAGKLKDIKNHDFGEPLHSIIIPGELHDVEKEMLDQYLYK